jgi:hypothetical protein
MPARLLAVAPSGTQNQMISRSAVSLRIKMIRPSLLDQRFAGDPWIVDRGEGSMAICLGNYPVAWLDELPFDLPALNQLFCSLRRSQARRPRPGKKRSRPAICRSIAC